MSARARWLGTVIALLALAALGAIAWYLTHRPAAAPAGGAAVGAPGPGGAASAGGRGGGPGAG